MSEEAKFNIRGEPFKASERDVSFRWNCKAKGEDFRCAWCGHRFEIGDTVRCIYTNGGGEETQGIGGNPFICDSCNGPRDIILAKLREMASIVRQKYWWFAR